MQFIKRVKVLADTSLQFKLNYAWHTLVKGRVDDYLDKLYDLSEDNKTYFKSSDSGFTLTGEQNALKASQKAILQQMAKDLPRVKVWQGDKVVLDNFGKQATDVDYE